MHLRLFAAPDITSIATIQSLCALSDPFELFRSRDINKYWTSYVHGNLVMLKELLSKPGVICWVIETDASDLVGTSRDIKSMGEEPEYHLDDEKSHGGEVVGWIIWERSGESNVARNWRMGKDGWGDSLNRTLLSLTHAYTTLLNPTINHHHTALLHPYFSAPSLPFPESWHLQALYINPSHQRRGLGTLAVKWGIEQADREGVPIVVDSSAMGVALYEKLGFVKVEQQFLGMEFADERKGLGMWKLVKEPGGGKTSWIQRAREEFEVENPK